MSRTFWWWLLLGGLAVTGCDARSADEASPPGLTAAAVVERDRPSEVDVGVHFEFEAICLAPGGVRSVHFVNDTADAVEYATFLQPISQGGVVTYQLAFQGGGLIPVVSTPVTWPPIMNTVLPAGDSVEFSVAAPEVPGTYELSVMGSVDPRPTLEIIASPHCAAPPTDPTQEGGA